jgi:hypothetical protein
MTLCALSKAKIVWAELFDEHNIEFSSPAESNQLKTEFPPAFTV